jgi:hypothetical protein
VTCSASTLDLGDVVHLYLMELTHRRPRIWVRDVERLHALLQQHGPTVLIAACEQALRDQAFGAEYIAHFITSNGAPASVTQLELRP